MEYSGNVVVGQLMKGMILLERRGDVEIYRAPDRNWYQARHECPEANISGVVHNSAECAYDSVQALRKKHVPHKCFALSPTMR